MFFQPISGFGGERRSTGWDLARRVGLTLVWQCQVDDDEIFKICTEYWNFLADDLYHKEVQMQRPMAALMLSPTPVAQSPRLQTYSPILAQARRILIDRMPKPEVPPRRPFSILTGLCALPDVPVTGVGFRSAGGACGGGRERRGGEGAPQGRGSSRPPPPTHTPPPPFFL